MSRTSLCLAAAVLLAVSFAAAQTVDEIVAKNIEAHGGMAKLKSVQTLRVSGTYVQGSFRARFVQENKRPDKVREENIIQGMTAIDAYDGKTGWRISPFGGRKDPELVSEDDLKGLSEDADIDGPLVDYKQKGHKAEFVGHEPVEGTDCYKIKLTLKNGDVFYYYIDTDSNLEIKVEQQRMVRGEIQETESYLGDYEQVNGIYFPFAFEQGEKRSPDRTKYTVDKVEINMPVNDSQFTMPSAPAQKAELNAPAK